MKKGIFILYLTAVMAFFLNVPWMAGALECTLFPADNIWNAPIDTLPVHVHSDDYIATIGANSVIWGPLNSTVFSGDNEERAKYYESCIVKEIVKCDSKFVLLSSSKSINLQDYANLKAQKARFLKAEKAILVKEMTEMQLEPKHYKVEMFLNSRFQEKNRYKK